MLDANQTRVGGRCRAALVKAPGERVRLRLDFGDAPAPGDELRTASGRRYLVTGFKDGRITAFVLPRDAPIRPRAYSLLAVVTEEAGGSSVERRRATLL
jgi:hypothetical protein